MSKIDYSKMTDAEFYVECADGVGHLATQIMTISRQTAMTCRWMRTKEESDRFASPMLEHSMRPMLEMLGNLLNVLDAYEEKDDSWVDSLFHELHRRFPHDNKAAAPQQQGDTADEAGDAQASPPAFG